MKNKEKLATGVEEESATVTGEKTKKSSRVISIIINVILTVAIILAALCTYVSFVSTSGNGVPGILGFRPFSVQTESMAPTLMPGDLVIGRKISDTSTLKVGDIITYWTVIEGERVLNTHRINEIYKSGDHLIFQTKGDNNTSVDTMTVHETSLVGIYQFKINGLGKVFDYLQTPTGFLIVVVIPVLLFFIFHLVQFFRVLFEYQNVKNRLKYEQERGRTEDLIEEERQKETEDKEKVRAQMEAELREKLKAELLADMAKKESAEDAAPSENSDSSDDGDAADEAEDASEAEEKVSEDTEKTE